MKANSGLYPACMKIQYYIVTIAKQAKYTVYNTVTGS